MSLGYFGRDRMRLMRDINERLNAANGYRRFGGLSSRPTSAERSSLAILFRLPVATAGIWRCRIVA